VTSRSAEIGISTPASPQTTRTFPVAGSSITPSASSQRPTVHRAQDLDVADRVKLELSGDARLDHVDQGRGDGLRLRPVDEAEVGLGILAWNLRHEALVDAVGRCDDPAKEKRQVKKGAKDMLHTLKAAKLVLDWRKRRQARAVLQVCIGMLLHKPPPARTPEIYRAKGDAV
jgi:hypothetical protein